MNRLLASLLMIGVVVGMTGAATWAQFSDTETSSVNTFTAGVIDLEIDSAGDTIFSAQDDPLPKIFDYMPANDIKPGDLGEVTLSLHLKDGVDYTSNNADLWMQVLNLENNGGANPEPEQEAEELVIDDDIASEITVLVWLDDGDNSYEPDGNDGIPDNEDDEILLHGGTLTSLSTAGKLTVQEDAVACTTYYVGFSWVLGDVGNEHQGDQCTFDIVFGADQIVPS